MQHSKLPADGAFAEGVLRELWDERTFIVWIPGDSDRRFRHWHRISARASGQLVADRFYLVSARITLFRERIDRGLSSFIRRLSGSSAAEQWHTPNGNQVERIGKTRTDAILLWSADPQSTSTDSLIKALWPDSEAITTLATNLWLIVRPGEMKRGLSNSPEQSFSTMKSTAPESDAETDLQQVIPPSVEPERVESNVVEHALETDDETSSQRPAKAPATRLRHASRAVRVFVSSSFRDMQAERDELMKYIFPRLRKLCEDRGLSLTEVDLRWGITEEQAEQGQLLPIVLDEIDRCRPYFIGILGQRYGWVPDKISQDLVDRYPWLAEHRQRSVTELEIVHGVLNNPAMARRAFFYFRDPAYLDQVSGDQRDDFVDQDDQSRRKLEALKERIRSSGLPVHNYPDPQALGQLVLEHLSEAISEENPVEPSPDSLQREAAEHQAFAESRLDVYVGGQQYFDRLDAHVAGSGPPLVIMGESGLGKSALLANWAEHFRANHPQDLLVTHFIGATPYSADWGQMLRRIMEELKRRFDIDQYIPEQPDALRSAFSNLLEAVAKGGRTVLVLDALNQLEDRDRAPDLVWLPPEIPANVRLVVSTLPGRSSEELSQRGWPTLKIEPLGSEQRQRLIQQYLSRYQKTLTSDQLKRIGTAHNANNPLFLRTLLDELRLFGVYEQLDERIDFYLDAGTIEDLYDRVLARYEQDFQRDREGLVCEAMSLIWASRRGLSEAELLAILGEDHAPLPVARWSPLYIAAEQSLVTRSGLIGFSHDFLRKAVETRYLPTLQTQWDARLRLSEYFSGQDTMWRMVDELPWQLSQAEQWQRLYDLLADLTFFRDAWSNSPTEVLLYWSQIEDNSHLRLLDA